MKRRVHLAAVERESWPFFYTEVSTEDAADTKPVFTYFSMGDRDMLDVLIGRDVRERLKERDGSLANDFNRLLDALSLAKWRTLLRAIGASNASAYEMGFEAGVRAAGGDPSKIHPFSTPKSRTSPKSRTLPKPKPKAKAKAKVKANP